MALDLPPLPNGQAITDPKTGAPTLAFTVYWQQLLDGIEGAVNAVADAQAAAAAANAAAVAADTAASNAQTVADNVTVSQSLASSYVSGATITATDAGANVTISISAHTRYYPQSDGSLISVAVNAGSITGLAYSTQYFIFYDDPDRTGGAVTYQQTNNAVYAAQIGELHVVGAVTTPAALGGPISGSYTRPPGSGAISNL